MLVAVGQVPDDAFGLAGRDEFAGRQLVAEHVVIGGFVEPVAAQGDAGAAAAPEFLDHVGVAVAIRVAQGVDALLRVLM